MTRKDLEFYLDEREQGRKFPILPSLLGFALLGALFLTADQTQWRLAGSYYVLGIWVGIFIAKRGFSLRRDPRQRLAEILEREISKDPESIAAVANLRAGIHAEQAVQPDRREDAAPG
jgi:hypothetical protein